MAPLKKTPTCICHGRCQLGACTYDTFFFFDWCRRRRHTVDGIDGQFARSAGKVNYCNNLAPEYHRVCLPRHYGCWVKFAPRQRKSKCIRCDFSPKPTLVPSLQINEYTTVSCVPIFLATLTHYFAKKEVIKFPKTQCLVFKFLGNGNNYGQMSFSTNNSSLRCPSKKWSFE